jgi:Uma2 family endonuclease
MIQSSPKLLTFDEFVQWLPEDRRYELHRGAVVEMQPTGKHEDITGFLTERLTLEYTRSQLPYRIPPKALVKPQDKDTGYNPDLLIIDRRQLPAEPLWEKRSTLVNGGAIVLIVEVVSSNWRDDYGYKLSDYEATGIKEYWIVDYQGVGGVRFIGQPKRPTISIYSLVDGEYQVQQFRDNQAIHSPTFPELNLTAAEIFQA